MNVRRPILAIALSLGAACGDALGPITELPRELSVAERELIQADNRFAFKLFREVNAWDTTSGNILISPLSAAMALGMAHNGAAGSTREAMAETLELQGLDLQQVNEAYRSLIDLLQELDPRVEFLIGNSIWHDTGVAPAPSYLDLTRTYFDAEVAALDFASPEAPETINGWVSDATRGRIDEIVEQIPPNVVAYLINAIYFKGAWTYQFPKDETRTAAFRLADGGSASVDMMSYAQETPVRHYFDVETGTEVVDLAYGGGAYSMTIVLPSEPDGIDGLAGELTDAQWHAWTAALDSTDRLVSMPKYTLEYDIVMNDVLSALGMTEAFTLAADFSAMFPGGGVGIDEVRQKTFMEVNEEGTEAAAVTSISFFTSAPPSTVVDRPFLVAIRERYSGAILFMGKIMDPSTD
jgi:serine protease inhibitor